MTTQNNNSKNAADLRQKAEALAREQASRTPEDSAALSPGEIRETLHELRVHQIELEMQNEELRMAQAQIEAGRARYFDLYDLAPVGYATVSEKGLILEANLTLATLLNVNRGALVKQPISRFILKEDEDIYYLHRKKLFETGEPQECELRLVKPDGASFWAHLTATAAQAEDGAPVCRCVLTNITKRKQAEEEREKLRAQLTQAQKMESIGRLAGGVAHDFNNMLMGIMGYTELCQEAIGKDHPIQEYLMEIRCEAERSANLTRQLLAFARKQIIAPHVLELNDAVADMLKMLRRFIGEDIEMVWVPGANLYPVKVDPGQIDQILANLCVNARDAIALPAPPGTPPRQAGGVGKLTIETENVAIDERYCATRADSQPGEFVMLTVSDDGSGMDRETLDNIFEPFFTTKGVGEGTGLGLATVYGIVKQNEGFINVYSEPGEGTTFRIYLPRIVEETANAKRKIPTGPQLGGTETILLVEDEKSIRVTVSHFLQDLGYTVLTAESPEAALLLTTEHKGGLDLLLTDVVMPGMSGRELAEKLAGGDSHMKVIYMSGYTANVIAHRGIIEENVAFLSKPFARDELAAKVRETLDHE